jgi:uncharacterized phage protein (TIGR01671 family)
MHQIKFRKWDSENKEMIDGDSLAFEEYLPISQQLTQEGIMQFTGLKDRDGKEIYEGDIIEMDCGCDSEYGCSHGSYRSFVRWNSESASFGLAESDGKYGEEFDASYEDEYQIIGNIYENPELLEVVK